MGDYGEKLAANAAKSRASANDPLPPAPGASVTQIADYKQAQAEAELDRMASERMVGLEVDRRARLRHAAIINPRKPLSIVTDSDLEAREEPEWWIEGLIQKNSIAMLGGPPGIAKTFAAIHMTRALASDNMTKVWGQAAPHKARTLYVVAEGAQSFKSRVKAWNTHFASGVKNGDVAYVERGVNLSQPDSLEELAQVFTEGGYDLLVLDTWSQLSGLDDENPSAPTAALLTALRESTVDAREGASILIIHHTDARGTKLRGTTALKANVETVMMAVREGQGFKLTTEDGPGGKQKDAKPLTLRGFKLVDSGPSAVIEYSGKTPDSPYWKPIKDVLSDGLWHSSTDLREACGIASSTAEGYESWKLYIYGLSRDGVLEKDDTKPTRPKYKLAKALVGDTRINDEGDRG